MGNLMISLFYKSAFRMSMINKPAPKFNMSAFDKEIKKINLDDHKGKYVVLFFYPFDFTFVCPTEICNFSDAAKEFRKNNCEVLGASRLCFRSLPMDQITKKIRRIRRNGYSIIS